MTNSQMYFAIFLGVILFSVGFLAGMVVMSGICERSGHRKPPAQKERQS